MKKNSERRLVFSGMMAAAVYAASALLQIPIPTVLGTTRLHLGNAVCLLSGMLLGPVYGGMAAGIGSMLFDLTDPAYTASAPFTFAFKFAMAWLCGKICAACPRKSGFTAGAAAGAFLYVVLYLTKNFAEYWLVYRMPLEGVLLMLVQKGLAAIANALASVLVASPLGQALRPAVQQFFGPKAP